MIKAVYRVKCIGWKKFRVERKEKKWLTGDGWSVVSPVYDDRGDAKRKKQELERR